MMCLLLTSRLRSCIRSRRFGLGFGLVCERGRRGIGLRLRLMVVVVMVAIGRLLGTRKGWWLSLLKWLTGSG